jgi:putative membrane protein (TIGR04086 family)
MNGIVRMVKGLVKALLASCLVTAVFLLVLAYVLLKFQPDTQKMGIAILACYVISCLVGGFISGRMAEKRKFLWGLIAGSIYFVLLFAASGLGERAVPLQTMQILTAFVLCACSGMAGGMIASAR